MKTQTVAVTRIHSILNKNNSIYSYELQMRTKALYSTWRKMKSRNCNIEGILDILAFRLIVTTEQKSDLIHDDISLCYFVLGKIHRTWTPIPKTLKDYISHPKQNGYQSLHTTVLINGNPVEFQIRTSNMHRVAEWGTAAHWVYKEGTSVSWLQIVRKWEVDSTNKFMERIRNELLGTRVFVFGPHGRILNLAKGSQLTDVATIIAPFANFANFVGSAAMKKLLSRVPEYPPEYLINIATFAPLQRIQYLKTRSHSI